MKKNQQQAARTLRKSMFLPESLNQSTFSTNFDKKQKNKCNTPLAYQKTFNSSQNTNALLNKSKSLKNIFEDDQPIKKSYQINTDINYQEKKDLDFKKKMRLKSQYSIQENQMEKYKFTERKNPQEQTKINRQKIQPLIKERSISIVQEIKRQKLKRDQSYNLKDKKDLLQEIQDLKAKNASLEQFQQYNLKVKENEINNLKQKVNDYQNQKNNCQILKEHIKKLEIQKQNLIIQKQNLVIQKQDLIKAHDIQIKNCLKFFQIAKKQYQKDNQNKNREIEIKNERELEKAELDLELQKKKSQDLEEQLIRSKNQIKILQIALKNKPEQQFVQKDKPKIINVKQIRQQNYSSKLISQGFNQMKCYLQDKFLKIMEKLQDQNEKKVIKMNQRSKLSNFSQQSDISQDLQDCLNFRDSQIKKLWNPQYKSQKS